MLPLIIVCSEYLDGSWSYWRDTDSNFLLLENLYNVICENANLDKDEKVNIINVCNVIVYICSQYIQKVLDVFTGNMNIPEDKQPIINMKSELTCIIIIMELTIKSSNWRGVPLELDTPSYHGNIDNGQSNYLGMVKEIKIG